jgi:DNA-binding response OmpR family regulator
MSLSKMTVLVVCDDPLTATQLVETVARADGDTVFAANAYEADLRLKQFKFDAAVLAWDAGAMKTAASIHANSVPLCILAAGRDCAPPDVHGRIVDGLHDVVRTLETLLQH